MRTDRSSILHCSSSPLHRDSLMSKPKAKAISKLPLPPLVPSRLPSMLRTDPSNSTNRVSTTSPNARPLNSITVFWLLVMVAKTRKTTTSSRTRGAPPGVTKVTSSWAETRTTNVVLPHWPAILLFKSIEKRFSKNELYSYFSPARFCVILLPFLRQQPLFEIAQTKKVVANKIVRPMNMKFDLSHVSLTFIHEDIDIWQ